MPTSTIGAPAVLQCLPDMVVVADADGRIVYTNPAVRTLLGHDPADLQGAPLTALVPERFRAAHAAGFDRFVGTGTGRLFDATLQLPALHRDGTEVTIELSLSPLDRSDRLAGMVEGVDGGVVVAVLRDASTAIRLERQLEVSRYLTATLRVTAALAEAADSDVAFDQLLPSLCAELDWDAAALWQPDPDDGRLVHAASWSARGASVPALEADIRGRSFVRGEGLPGTVWQRRSPVVVEDLWSAPGFVRWAAVRADALRTAVAFPVLHGSTLLGVCELFSRRLRPVPTELVDVLAGAGRQIGQFLARLRAESQLREVADTLQRSLLPAHLPVVPGIQLAARYRAGADGVVVGGDTYDVLPLAGDRWMVLIADVCGTGAEAASLTSLTRHTARAAASWGAGPGQIMAAVNSALLHAQDDEGPLKFVTAACLEITPRDGGAVGRLVVGGHPPPLLRLPDGTVRELHAGGRPLGIEQGAAWAEVPVELVPGSTLVLYTDGVTEARDRAGAQFGEDGLAAALATRPFSTATGAVDAVHAAVEEHLRGSRRAVDDLAVLALRC